MKNPKSRSARPQPVHPIYETDPQGRSNPSDLGLEIPDLVALAALHGLLAGREGKAIEPAWAVAYALECAKAYRQAKGGR